MPGTPRPPSPAQRRLQAEIVERLHVLCRVGNDDIAAVAGVDDTMVSKWITEGRDCRKMELAEAVRLAAHFGWDVVFGSAAKDWRFERIVWEAADLEGEASAMVREALDLTDHLRTALDDGILDEEERAILRRALSRISQRYNRIGAGISQ